MYNLIENCYKITYFIYEDLEGKYMVLYNVNDLINFPQFDVIKQIKMPSYQ